MEAMASTATLRPLARRRHDPVSQKSQPERAGRERVEQYRTPSGLQPRNEPLSLSRRGRNVGVVQPSNTSSRTGTTHRNAARPPRQMLNPQEISYSNPYLVDLSAKEHRSLAQRENPSRTKTTRLTKHRPPPATWRAIDRRQSRTLSRAPTPLPSCHKVRSKLRSVKAKVDSHLCPNLCGPERAPFSLARPLTSPLLPLPVPNGGRNKSLAEAHQQLELMLTRIERANEYLPSPPPLPAARRNQVAGRGIAKVAKGVRRKRAPVPPAPACSPMLSARSKRSRSRTQMSRRNREGGLGARGSRGDSDEEEQRHHQQPHPPGLVPLAGNPQHLPLARREALLELLQRAEQHDKGLVDIVRGVTGDPSRDTMLMVLQMLPLSLDESPYRHQFWDGHRYLRERQKLHQKLRPGDARFKEVKVLRSPDGQVFLSRTLEEELRDEKMVLEYMEAEMRRKRGNPQRNHVANPQVKLQANLLSSVSGNSGELNERQEQAMRERAELDKDKQQVTKCREQRRRLESKRKLAEMMKQKMQATNLEGGHPNKLARISEEEIQKEVQQQEQRPQRRLMSAAASSKHWKQLLQERDRFQTHCMRSCFYNNSRSSAPWKIYAK
ncbi:hypothetical protein KR009_002525 [Drosophila setifemur]|nr:hypothetical protein KR009_002525 [Drosophila setifemur]